MIELFEKQNLEFINIISFFVFDNLTIKDGIATWFRDKKMCEISNYGHITFWNTSNITNMNSLFFKRRDLPFYSTEHIEINNYNDFNELLLWDTSKVVNMHSCFGD